VDFPSIGIGKNVGVERLLSRKKLLLICCKVTLFDSRNMAISLFLDKSLINGSKESPASWLKAPISGVGHRTNVFFFIIKSIKII